MSKKIIEIFVVMLFVGAGVMPSINGYPTSKPDLIVYSPGPNGNDIYESPPPTIQIYGSTFHNAMFYLFLIDIQNDGDSMMNCTIQTNKLTGWTFPTSVLYYPTYQGFSTMPLTSTPQWLPMILQNGHLLMLLIVIKLPFFPQVQVRLDAVSLDNKIDSVIVHT